MLAQRNHSVENTFYREHILSRALVTIENTFYSQDILSRTHAIENTSMPHQRRGPRGNMPLLGPQELAAIRRSVGVDVGVHAPEDLVNKRQRHMHAA